MNMTFSPADFINLIVVAVGILIKMELHDIKSRITRLENIFITPVKE